MIADSDRLISVHTARVKGHGVPGREPALPTRFENGHWTVGARRRDHSGRSARAKSRRTSVIARSFQP